MKSLLPPLREYSQGFSDSDLHCRAEFLASLCRTSKGLDFVSSFLKVWDFADPSSHYRVLLEAVEIQAVSLQLDGVNSFLV